MAEKITDGELSDFMKELGSRYPPKWYIRVLAKNLQDARKELEEAKKDSVWRDAPNYAEEAVVYYREPESMYFHSSDRVIYKRTLLKTPEQELIDSFAEKNALAMKCSGLNKELLEAFVKEYEETKDSQRVHPKVGHIYSMQEPAEMKK